MNLLVKLTTRETEIAELFAWGASKKEVANHLNVSERTVENHARNIYEKTGCGKVNELSAWWFCTRFNISFDLSPLKKKVLEFIKKQKAMKNLINEFRMPGLTWKQKLIVWYFIISFCSLCITDDSPLWAIAFVVLNFANAARLIRKVPLPEIDNEKNERI